jgi:hypothetical protein
VFAIITVFLAYRAFRKQSQEVTEQASMLNVQSEQLAERRKINEKQIEVLELQADELRESLAERKREAERQYRGQASRVYIAQARNPTAPHGHPEPEGVAPFVTVLVGNTSERPVYDAELRWHLGAADYGEPNAEPLGTIMPRSEVTKQPRTYIRSPR